jgi:hypothetical protein
MYAYKKYGTNCSQGDRGVLFDYGEKLPDANEAK